MNGNGHHRFNTDTWSRIKREIRALGHSEEGRKSIFFFALLIAFLMLINGLNVLNSYVGRDFISAIENRNHGLFLKQAVYYVGVFGLSTIAAVLYRYLEERLGLLWRTQQTRRLMCRYLNCRTYFRIETEGELQNPDQRISEDVRSFTTTTLSFVLMSLNGTFTVFAFSSVLWEISPPLFGIAVAYAALGSLIATWLGRPLIGLNGLQLDKEANLRSELLHVRENAESIALSHREPHLSKRLTLRFDAVMSNTRRMISVNRNLGFFTNGYNYLIQIIPALVVAPMFMRGNVEFGVVTQSAMAFSYLMGAFSLLITQFQSISSYAAVVARLGKLMDAMDRADAPSSNPIEIEVDGDHLKYKRLSLTSSDGKPLLTNLDLTIEPGQRVLIRCGSGHAKVALFRATAGFDTEGSGSIERPGADALLFVPERPYMPRGVLRELLLDSPRAAGTTQAALEQVLKALRIDTAIADAGGLGADHDWQSRLGVAEQCKLVVARILLAKPAVVFLDRLRTSLDAADVDLVLKALGQAHIGYLMLGKPGDSARTFDGVLDIEADGSWHYMSTLRPAPTRTGQ